MFPLRSGGSHFYAKSKDYQAKGARSRGGHLRNEEKLRKAPFGLLSEDINNPLFSDFPENPR